ncbi:hypothetical protein BDF20DRAFT_906948 [Mycotypha africana]|uniref:uncharacterized protein n=1 Tax=Mycotypha africana TaxID=64632 RepID=UPI0023003544|nr:uncharacterized protein BDF20DRAFT_906948 [Mycotypha africana]KAI8973269.1 hypothetical protein BDF20DRAFT_906948 [Mycotypha africana]
MYGAKGTSTILNSVTRQGVLTKQLVAPKSTAFLANLPTRQVSVGKLSYTTRSQTQFNQVQEPKDVVAPSAPINVPPQLQQQQQQQQQQHAWTSAVSQKSNNYGRSSAIEATGDITDNVILQEARKNNLEKVSAAGETVAPAFSTKTYEAVIEAYSKLRKKNQPLTPMLNAYQDMVSTGIQPSSETYSLLIRSLCTRDAEVQKTIKMLQRQVARTGRTVNNLPDLESERNLEKALSLFNEAVKRRSTQAFDVDVYNNLLRGVSFNGNVQDGLYVLEQLETSQHVKPNGTTFAALLALFGVAGDLKAAQECFLEYQSLRRRLPRHDASLVYNALVYAYCDAGDVQGALNIVERVMTQDNVKISILPYNKILRRACSDGNMDYVNTLLSKLESTNSLVEPDASTYGVLLSTYCRMADFDKASEAYEKLLKYDISKQYGHFADYAYACLGNNKTDMAFKIVQDMTSRGLIVDSSICRNIVMAYTEKNKIDEAVKAFDSLVKMYSKTHYVAENSPIAELALDLVRKCDKLQSSLSVLTSISNYRIHPTKAASEVVTQQYLQAKSNKEKWQDTLSTLNERSFTHLYDAVFHKSNTPEEFCNLVFELLKDMRDLKLPLTSGLYVRVLSRMKKYGVADYERRWKEEFTAYLNIDTSTAIKNKQTVEELIISKSSQSTVATSKVAVEADALSSEALTAALEDRFDTALDILNNKIIKQGKTPTPEAVRDMIAKATKVNSIDSARDIYDTVIESMEKLEGVRQQRGYQTIYNAMLIAHARHGDLESAREFYKKLVKLGLRPNADGYGALLAATANTDESNEALAIYEEAKKYNVRPTVYFYNVILSKLSRSRKLDNVLELFNEMKQNGLIPSSITYASVISACLRCSSESRAIHFFQEMLNSAKFYPRVGPFNSMVQFYVQEKPDREKALEYYNYLKQYNLKPSDYTLKLLMEAYANIPPYDMLTAHKILTDMSKKYGIEPQPMHYACLIRSYGCLHRDVQSAIAVYKEMEKAGVEANETVYQAMLNTYTENRDMSSAEQLYQKMLQQGTESSPYIENLFITGYGAQGNMEKAEEVFNRMDKPGQVNREPSTYEAMAKVYAENGEIGKVKDIVNQMREQKFPEKVVDGVVQLLTPAQV